MTKRFGAFTALDHVAWRCRPAQFHVLLGENGAGKSTLVKCIMGFYQPDEGTIAVDGQRGARCATRATRGRSASAWSTSTSRWCPR